MNQQQVLTNFHRGTNPRGAAKPVYQMSYNELVAAKEYWNEQDGHAARVMRSRIEEAMRAFLAVRA